MGDVKVWENIRTVVTEKEVVLKASWRKIGTYDDWHWNFWRYTNKQNGLKKIITTKYYRGDTLIDTKTTETIVRPRVDGEYKQGSKTELEPYDSYVDNSLGSWRAKTMYRYQHPVTKDYRASESKTLPVTKDGWGTATYTYPSEWDR